MSTTQINGGTQIQANTITSGQVNASILVAGGTNAFTADQSMGGHKLTNVAAPVSGGDAANKTYVDGAVTGLLDFKGSTDCSATPNYPAALKGDTYFVSVAGKIGGAAGKSVDVGDVFVASADNAGGTEVSVGTSWFVMEHNLVGALLASNNLSDVANAGTARTNLGGTTVGGNFFTLTNPTAITFPRINADNSVSALSAGAFLTAIGAGTGSGTVTAIGVTTANGVSGTSSGGATPNLTLTLAAITPTTVNGNTFTTGTGTLTLSTFTLTVAGTASVSGTHSGTSSGTNTGDQTITLTGGVTGSGTGSFAATVITNANLTGNVTSVGNATTIAAGVVTLAMQANMATASLVYRKTAGTGAPEVNTLATLKTDLGLTGTNSGDQTITLTGGVTGSGTGSFAATVITNANLTGNVTSVGNATTIAAGVVTEAMQILANNTTNDVSITKHGYAPIAPNDATKFLRGDATWAVPTGAAGVLVNRETPSGTVNGSNVTFTLANTPISGTEMLFVNGILQDAGAGNDYTISGAVATFLTGSIPQTGDKVRATYWK